MKIPFKSKLVGIRDITKRNEKFNSMGKEQQRKEIAFDALMLLVKKEIKGSRGTYWDEGLKDAFSGSLDSKGAQKNLIKHTKKVKNCDVCARGACMLSIIRLGNNIDPNVSDAYDVSAGDWDMRSQIKGFTYSQFCNMENSFEGASWEYASRKIPYSGYDDDENDSKKLACILANIIKNGKYKVSDSTDYVVRWKLRI